MHIRSIRTLLPLASLVLVACAPIGPLPAGEGDTSAAGGSAAHTGGILRIGQNAGDLGTLDPDYASGAQDRALLDMVLNGMVRYKPGDATKFEPDLAVTLPGPITDASGRQEWTFYLRQGVMCQPSDGVPAYELTSEDVVYSLRKAANKETSAYSSDYAGMSFDNPGPYTVTVTLDEPMSSALFYPRFANYLGGYILCRRAAEKLGPDGLKTHPVGTGPFMFKDYLPKEKVDLVANPDYFRGRPQLDGVEYRYIADVNSRELGLRGGQLDLIYGLQDGKWVDEWSGESGFKVDVFGVGEVSTIYFNLTRPPFDNVLVRRAVASALSRDELLRLYGTSVARKVFSPVPRDFMAGGLSEPEVAAANLDYPYDPARARELLRQAGVPNGFEFSVVSSEEPAYRAIYESVQAQLARVGIKMNVNLVDDATMHDQIRKDVNPVVVYVAFRPTADAYLTQFFHSDATVVTGEHPNLNFSHYDRIDDEIESARTEEDTNRQTSLWKDAQSQALADMVAYPIMYANQVYARSTAVDYGHKLQSAIQLYPGIDERTRLTR